MTSWINIGDITLNEINQAQNDKYHMLSHVKSLSKYKKFPLNRKNMFKRFLKNVMTIIMYYIPEYC